MPQVRLKVAHTHDGKPYPAGHVIEVDDRTARWLAEHDIATPANAAPRQPFTRPEKLPKE